jgi:hypothetical protein
MELANQSPPPLGEDYPGNPTVCAVGLPGDQRALLDPVDQAGHVGLVAAQQAR